MFKETAYSLIIRRPAIIKNTRYIGIEVMNAAQMLSRYPTSATWSNKHTGKRVSNANKIVESKGYTCKASVLCRLLHRFAIRITMETNRMSSDTSR